MPLQAVYSCATCGFKHIEKQERNQKFVEKKELWHECTDNYDVPVQCAIERIKDEPTQKKDHK